MLAFINILNYFILVIFLSNCGATNYCDTHVCNNSKQHTLCKFQSQDPARHCVDYEKTINTAKEKQAILNKLNSRRNKVAAGDLRSLPSAENMMKLEWNEDLELSAQRWANQCVKHSTPDIKDVCRDLGTMYVEQNIATIVGESPGLTPLALIDVWYMELLNVNASIIPRYQRSKDMKMSHYDYFTQLVWATSNQVGCGGVKFKERLQDSGSDKKRVVYRLVCNFAPGGNIVNHTVYKGGPPCSSCPDGTCDAVHTSLCSSENQVQEQKSIHESIERTQTELAPPPHKLKHKYSKIPKAPEPTEDMFRFLNLDKEPKEDNENIPLDLFTHTSDFVRPILSTTVKPSSCKDMVVDDFVELLKKKLSTDPMFRDLLQNSLGTTERSENTFTDALELIGQLYNNKASTVVTKPPEKQSLNSTHLVDLIEAIIFRNADKTTPERLITASPPEFDVNPVMVQAELAEVKRNPDFTGHLFFPEDATDDRVESTEQYYDVVTSHPQVDFAMDDVRITKATKDFIDEILESETMSESHNDYNVVDKRDTQNLKKRYNTLEKDYFDSEKVNQVLNGGKLKLKVPESFKKYDYILSPKCKCGIYLTKYRDLLKRLACDLDLLKLNEKYHCAKNSSPKNYYIPTNIITFALMTLESSFCIINYTFYK